MPGSLNKKSDSFDKIFKKNYDIDKVINKKKQMKVIKQEKEEA